MVNLTLTYIMIVNPEHTVINCAENIEHCGRENFDDKVNSAFYSYKRCKL